MLRPAERTGRVATVMQRWLPAPLLLVGVLPRAGARLSVALGTAVLVTGLLPVGLTLAAGVLAGAVPGALRGGRVLETGSHACLMAQGGAYAELFALQARAYRA